MGYAGVFQFGGLRIAAVSGIHKHHDVHLGHFEKLPYDNSTMRSVYHTRALEAYRMIQINNMVDPQPVDIVLTHDWPLNIHTCGNVDCLLRKKPFFRQDVQRHALGNPLYEPVVRHLKPRFWYSAHLHVEFKATVNFGPNLCTNFLALDKCLPRRPYYQLVDIEPKNAEGAEKVLQYDAEWLSILKKTNKYMSVERNPRTRIPDVWITAEAVTDDNLVEVIEAFGGDLNVPYNFTMSEPVLSSDNDIDPARRTNYPNPQTVEFCRKLKVLDPITELICGGGIAPVLPNPDKINLSDEDENTESNNTLNSESAAPIGNPDKIDLSDEDECQDQNDAKKLKTEDAVPLFFIDTKGTVAN
jgi:lariat debranching enzyme